MRRDRSVERKRSFERLYRRHHGDVLRFLQRQLGNREDAEDVTQTAFLKAYRALLRGRPPDQPRAWLFTIARNESRRHFQVARRHAHNVALAEDQLVAPAPEAVAAAEIRGALAELPERQRAAVLLREFEGLSYDEIARELDLSVSSVQMLLFRARRSLRSQLETVGSRAYGALVLPLPRWYARLGSLFGSSPGSGRLAARAAVLAAAAAVGAGVTAKTGVLPLGGPSGAKGALVQRGSVAASVPRAHPRTRVRQPVARARRTAARPAALRPPARPVRGSVAPPRPSARPSAPRAGATKPESARTSMRPSSTPPPVSAGDPGSVVLAVASAAASAVPLAIEALPPVGLELPPVATPAVAVPTIPPGPAAPAVAIPGG